MNSIPANSELVTSAIEALRQGETILRGLSDEQYTRKVPVMFNGSIGGHYRHCLDHFQSLLAAAVEGDLNYDQRERGTLIETDRAVALAATLDLLAGYEQFETSLIGRELLVTCKTSFSTAHSQSCGSLVGRELMYVVAHAVHHYAIMGAMTAIMGLSVPQGFGVAPSTLKYQERTAQAA